MTLEHYSPEQFTFDSAREYKPRRSNFKPTGFWFSIKGEHGWPDHCIQDQWNLEGLKFRYEVKITESANILHISTAAELLAFDREYGYESYPGEGYSSRAIEWSKITEKYDGIIISPYQWSLRMEPFWYYSWDVASGCVWNLEAIESVELKKARKFKS
jgi:hypothetical protein